MEKPFIATIREQIDNGSLTGGADGQQQLVGAAFALLAGTFGGGLPANQHHNLHLCAKLAALHMSMHLV